MALLSKLGLYRKNPSEGDGAGASTGPGFGASGLSSSGLFSAGGGGGAVHGLPPLPPTQQHQQQDLSCSYHRNGGQGPAQLRQPGGRGLLYSGPRLVALSLEVCSGVNLAIPSPHRKSRRTPSVEAIEALAGGRAGTCMGATRDTGAHMRVRGMELTGAHIGNCMAGRRRNALERLP